MNIALVTNNYSPIISGVAVSTLCLKAGLSKLGHTVSVFAPKYPGYKDNESNIFRLKSLSINYRAKYPLPLPCKKKLCELFKSNKIDIVHSQHPLGLGAAAIDVSNALKLPMVFTYHTNYFEYLHYIPKPFQYIGLKYLDRSIRKYLIGANIIISPSEKLKNTIQAKYGINNVISIPSGMSEVLYNTEKSSAISNSIEDAAFGLCVTRLASEKNIGFVISLANYLLEKIPNFKIYIAGDGYLKKKIMDIKPKNLVLLGNITQNKLADYYSKCSFLLFVSKSETQGLPIVESIPFNKRIFALQSDSSEEFILQNGLGIILPEDCEKFGNEIIKYISSSELFKIDDQLKEKYSPIKFAKNVERVYCKLYKRKNE